MSLSLPGTNISISEVTNVSPLGFWILTEGIEYFISFRDYPEFHNATVYQLFNVRQIAPGQLHWPDLDLDIEIESLDNPEKYPLIFKNG